MTLRMMAMVLAVTACAAAASASPALELGGASSDVGEAAFLAAVRRQNYGETLQRDFVAKGIVNFVSVTGAGFRALRITGESITKPVADQMRSDGAAIWRNLGFEFIEISNGQGLVWTQALK